MLVEAHRPRRAARRGAPARWRRSTGCATCSGRSPRSAGLAGSPALLDLVEPVLGPGAFAVRGLLFDKTPGANWGVPWHQDLTIAVRERVEAPGFGPWTVKAGIPHVRPPVGVLEGMLTLRVHLDDCDAARGRSGSCPARTAAGRLGAEATRDWLERGPAGRLPGPPGRRRDDAARCSSTPRRPPTEPRPPAGRSTWNMPPDPCPAGVDWFEAVERSSTYEVHEDARDRQRLRLRQHLRPAGARPTPSRLADRRQRPPLRGRLRRPDPDRPVASGPTPGCGCSTPTARSRRCAATASAASPSTSTTTGSPPGPG